METTVTEIMKHLNDITKSAHDDEIIGRLHMLLSHRPSKVSKRKHTDLIEKNLVEKSKEIIYQSNATTEKGNKEDGRISSRKINVAMT